MFKSKKKAVETGWAASRSKSITNAANPPPSPTLTAAAEVGTNSVSGSSATTTTGFDDDDNVDNLDITVIDDDAYSSGDDDDAVQPVVTWRPPTNEAALTCRKSILLGTSANPLAPGRLPSSAHLKWAREVSEKSSNNLHSATSHGTVFQRNSFSGNSSPGSSSSSGSSSTVLPSDHDITWAVPLSRARESGPAARYAAILESILHSRRRHGFAEPKQTGPSTETSAAAAQSSLETEKARRKEILGGLTAAEAQTLRETLEELTARPFDLADQVESTAAFLEAGQGVATQRIKESFLLNKRLDGIGDLESTERLLARGRLKDHEIALLLAPTSLRKAAVPQSRLGLSRRIAYGDGDYYTRNNNDDDDERGSIISSDNVTPRSSVFSNNRANGRGLPPNRTQSMPSGSTPTAIQPSPSTAPVLRYPQSASAAAAAAAAAAEVTALPLASVSAAGGVLNSVKDRLRAALTSSNSNGSNAVQSYQNGPLLRRGEVIDPATLNRAQRQAYGRLLGALAAQKPRPAALARLLRSSQAQSASSDVSLRLIRTLLFSLFGNPCDAVAEAQLLGLFQLLLAHEFAGGQLGTFMRANTATTAMLAAYGRRPSTVAVLQQALGDIVREMATSTLSLEVNPVKVYLEIINEVEALTGKPHATMRREGVTTEMATRHPEVSARLSTRFDTLADFVTRLVDELVAFADRFPYGVRWLTQQLDYFARKSFGDPNGSDQQQQHLPASTALRAARVQCLEGNLSVEELVALEARNRTESTSARPSADGDSNITRTSGATEAEITAVVSGFLLLRIINPLLVAPDEGGLLPAKTSSQFYNNGSSSCASNSKNVGSRRTSSTKSISAVTREGKRNLVLIAKILQTMSSGVVFGSKEKHMEPLNELLVSLAPKFRLFLEKVVRVPSNLSDAYNTPDLVHGSSGFRFAPALVLALSPQNGNATSSSNHRDSRNNSDPGGDGSSSSSALTGSSVSVTYNELVGLHLLMLEDPILSEPGQGTQSDDEVRAALVAIGPPPSMLDPSLDGTSHVRVVSPPNPFPPHVSPFETGTPLSSSSSLSSEVAATVAAELNTEPMAEPNAAPALPAYTSAYAFASSNRCHKRKLLLWDLIPASALPPPASAAAGGAAGGAASLDSQSSWSSHHQTMSSDLAGEIRILLHSVLTAAVHTPSFSSSTPSAVHAKPSTVANAAVLSHACDISLASQTGSNSDLSSASNSNSSSSAASSMGLETFLKYLIRAAGGSYSSIGAGKGGADAITSSENELAPSVQRPTPSLLLRQRPEGSSSTRFSSYLSLDSLSHSSSSNELALHVDLECSRTERTSEEQVHYLQALSETEEVESRRVFMVLGCHTLLRKLHQYSSMYCRAVARRLLEKDGGSGSGISKESLQAELHTWFLQHVRTASQAMANSLSIAREQRDIIHKCLREVNTVHSAQLTARARLCAAADAHIILEAAMAAATTSGGGLVNEMDEIDQLPSFDTHLSRSDSGGSSGSGGAPGEGLGEQRFKFELADLESWQVVVKSPVPAHEVKHIVLKVLTHPQKRPGRIDVAVKVRAGSMSTVWPKKTEVLFMDEMRDITGRGGFEVTLFGPQNPLVLNINFLLRFFKRAFLGLR